MLLGGYFINSAGFRVQLPIIENPTVSDVRECLAKGLGGMGVVVLSNNVVADGAERKLEAYFENGRYMIILEDYDQNGDFRFRSLNNLSLGKL